MEILMSGYYKGNKETGVHYSLFRAPMFDGTQVYGVMRDYGHHIDGTPFNAVSLVCIDDGTADSYHMAYTVFLKLVD